MICFAYVPMLLVAFWPGSRQLPLLDSLWDLSITLNRCAEDHGQLRAVYVSQISMVALLCYAVCGNIDCACCHVEQRL